MVNSMKHILTFMGVIFVLVGSIELVAFWSVQKSMSTYLEKEAIVTKVETDENGNRSVYVQYTIGDDIYREKLPTSASMEEGEKITIYYDSNNPHRIVEFAIKEAPLWVFILSGGIFALIGCIFLSIPIYISYKKKRIFSYHFIIYAKIEDVSFKKLILF